MSYPADHPPYGRSGLLRLRLHQAFRPHRVDLWATVALIFVLVLVLIGTGPVWAAAPVQATSFPLAVLWPAGLAASIGADQRGKVRNVIAPPSSMEPHVLFAPLPAEDMGTIRRVQLPANVRAVALTFDLCELHTSVSGFDVPLVNALRAAGAHATFFVGGKWMRSHPERTMQLMADPHFELGNHAWTHGNYGIMDVVMAREQTLWTQAMYESLRHELAQRAAQHGLQAAMESVPPALRLMRLPYGRCRPETLALLHQLGLPVIQWDVVGEAETDNAVPGAAERLMAHIRPGSIILLHANTVPQGTATLVLHLLDRLQAHGYELVTVSELLRMGSPERTMDGYFVTPGDNLLLDQRFGLNGTGARPTSHR